MTDYRCGQCLRVFTVDEFDRLAKVTRRRSYFRDAEGNIRPLIPNKVEKKYVCPNCGYVFGTDPWRINHYVEIKSEGGRETKVRLSTVYTEVNVGTPEEPLWYETVVREVQCDYAKRYFTKKEAIEGHLELVELLKKGRFKLNFPRGQKPKLVVLEPPAFDKAAAVLDEVKAEEYKGEDVPN